MKGSLVETTFTRTDMATLPGKLTEYSTFLAGLILQPSYTYELVDSTDVVVRLSVPGADLVPYGHLAPSKEIAIGGLNSFRGLEVAGTPVLQRTGTGFSLALDLNFKSSSPELTMRFGTVTLLTTDSEGWTVGRTVLEDFVVRPGDHNPVKAVVTGDTTDALKIYSVLRNTGDTFTLSGYSGSSKNLGVAGAFTGLKVNLLIPAIAA
ncbi:hypothetical protein BGX23_008432 [Mortierella sp. AD031]|nr:hypothetical protein BGX23_008432 [Mortierella sp. AD031]